MMICFHRSLRLALALGLLHGGAAIPATAQTTAGKASALSARDTSTLEVIDRAGVAHPNYSAFVPETYVDRSGRGDTMVLRGRAGALGTAAGQGATDASQLKDLKAGYQKVFRDLSTGVKTPVKAGAGEGKVGVGLPGRPSFNIPLIEWAGRLEDAEIKIGKFYLDFRELSGSVLWSDNIYIRHYNPKMGVIGIIGLGISAVYQASDNLRLAWGCKLAYLPFQNKVGFGDPLEVLSGTVTPLALAQLTYDIPIYQWDIQLFDTFNVQNGGYRWGESFDLFDVDTDAYDRAGRYAFRTPRDPDATSSRMDRLSSFFFRNRIGASASRLFPATTTFTVGGYHQDSWYAGDDQGRGQSQETLFVSAKCNRENLRFKPFADYRWTHASTRAGWDEVGFGGIIGPVTDQLDFLGELGYFQSGNSPRTSLMWTIRFDHQAGPYTSQSVGYRRQLTEPERTLRTGLMYNLTQIITPDITGELVFDRSDYEDLDKTDSGGIQWRAGVRFTYDMTSRLALQAGGYYRRLEFNDPNQGATEIYTARVTLQLQNSKTLTTRLTYQYEKRDSPNIMNQYDENMILLTITKRL